MASRARGLAPFAIAAVVLATTTLAPRAVHADDPASPPPAPIPLITPTASTAPIVRDARPFGMVDLMPATSVGVSTTTGWARRGAWPGGDGSFVGEVVLDAEYAMRRDCLLVFASLPLSYASKPGDSGVGNPRLGFACILVLGPVRTAIGGALSGGGSEESEAGLSLRHDLAHYHTDGVSRAFGDLRVRVGRGYAQLQLELVGAKHDSETETGGHEIAAAILGGGVALANGVAVVADAGVLHYFDRDDGGHAPDVLVVNAGLRAPMPVGPRATWGARASLHTGAGVTTFALGLELRTDLFPR